MTSGTSVFVFILSLQHLNMFSDKNIIVKKTHEFAIYS
jgi:hypothetical protein